MGPFPLVGRANAHMVHMGYKTSTSHYTPQSVKSVFSAEWSSEILSLCQEFSKDGVVGIDLAGDESLGEIPAMKGHIQAFKVCGHSFDFQSWKVSSLHPLSLMSERHRTFCQIDGNKNRPQIVIFNVVQTLYYLEGVIVHDSGVQGWHSGESTRLPLMWPGFDSQTRRHNVD